MNTSNKEDKQALRILMNAREDFQMQRKRMDNRIGRKADGSDMDIDERPFRADDVEMFAALSEATRDQEKAIEKKFKNVLKRFPVWTEYLSTVKGVGPVAGAQIIAYIDIHIATTVSKIWQYSGMNPSKVPGKKRVKTANAADYQPKEGKIVKRGEDYVILQTNERVRGDKLTTGFLCPYNKKLKTALLGVLANGFITQKNLYAIDFYYPYKERLKQSEKMVNEMKKGGKIEKVMWKDATPNHRHRAAIRFMMKSFLKDLYNNWRMIEGLEVRPPYQEEYLGHVHSG